MDLRVATPVLAPDGRCDDNLLPAFVWNGTVGSLPQCFEAVCDRTPGRVAVEVGPVHLTYTALDRRANQSGAPADPGGG